MEYFVRKESIVRKIWSKGDTVLFIFAGAAAEFALNKAVDWLYFTGVLPADPLQRLFSTVTYARRIVFSPIEEALKAIDKITAIHRNVELSRGSQIPEWAYRDVLYMLIHYSIASFELLEQPLTDAEKEEVYDVFLRMGARMYLKSLPENYIAWLKDRANHMQNDLDKTLLTEDLFRQYQKHLGSLRYWILIEGQKLVIPEIVRKKLNFSSFSLAAPLIFFYKCSRKVNVDGLIKNLILPKAYKDQISDLDKPFAQ